MKTSNENLPEPDFDFEEEQDDEPDYWHCYSCGYSCVRKPDFGLQCKNCTAIMSPENY